jgi:enamine deaminase RidA (YjgF/YER057c/UK114 family)
MRKIVKAKHVVAMALAGLAFVCTAGTACLMAQQEKVTTAALTFLSGVSANKSDGPTMTQQALATLKRLENSLKGAGVGLDQVVFVRAYLVPDSNGTVDYAGWEHASRTFFNNTRSRPTITAVALPLLEFKGSLIELECIVANKNPLPDDGMYWTAGMTAPVIKTDAPSDENRGDLSTQSHNTLLKLKDNLRDAGLTSENIVFVRAFLGPDKQGRFDFDGWEKAYNEFFKNEKSNAPPYITLTTPAFAGRGAMIEIEVVASFAKAPAFFSPPGSSKIHDFGEPTAMISSGVAVKAETGLYISGAAVPTVEGDMKTQALSALESLRSSLAEAGAGFKDVVFLRAYVPSSDGKFDLAGWQDAYATFFNTAQQPHKTARTTIAVQALPNPAWKIAIDAVAVVR